MTTVTQFAPNANIPFQFQATLSGPTPNVTATGPTYNVTVLWNTAGQRWYVFIADQNGNLVLNKPLIGSPSNFSINLVGGYFTGSSLVYLEQTNQFVVTP